MTTATKPDLALVLIEAGSKQAYIFASNKLREAVGASELISRAGTTWVQQAIRSVFGDGDPLAARIDDQPFEIVYLASGKALVLVRDAALGRQLVTSVTLRCTHEAPGLTVTGVVVPAPALGTGQITTSIALAHARLRDARLRIVGADVRAGRLPLIADCATTGLPAAATDDRAPGGEPLARSAEAWAKRRVAVAGIKRIETLLNQHDPGREVHLPLELDQEMLNEGEARFEATIATETRADETTRDPVVGAWGAVVHADANGLGEVFSGIPAASRTDADPSPDDRVVLDTLRTFSHGLDGVTAAALAIAIRKTVEEDPEGRVVAPIVPLILGGDDLTLYCAGAVALSLAREFLLAFSDQSSQGPVGDVTSRCLPIGRLGACAGVTITKPHFPFHMAYDISEDLVRSAKTIKQMIVDDEGRQVPATALDFHVQLDGASSSLHDSRKRMTAANGLRLHGRPYVLTDLDDLKTHGGRLDWAELHHWDDLQALIDALDDSELPRSKLHDLRDAMAGSGDLQTAIRQLRPRHRCAVRGLPTGDSSFTVSDSDGTFSRLMDALELQGLRPVKAT